LAKCTNIKFWKNCTNKKKLGAIFQKFISVQVSKKFISVQLFENDMSVHICGGKYAPFLWQGVCQ